ncbi:hypothetical protein LVJ83_11790 [Uruburuella testudinis]|uniref:YpeB-like protein with protease inhibitory function n=1 Tax=Uruburuella testudinis TaxID=1282863 RepID=A0ABY4DRC1_9NEIS|nr:hypothetical protein [Uruburuella testudinis]UOO81590.1 hypothetical protein LVJ83_11790 [Uruburuella testudinis]
MKNQSTAIVLTGIMALFSGSAFAASMPGEIYQPRGAEVIKADRQGNGEFEAEFRLHGNDVRKLARQVRNHAERHGFKVVESEIKRDDADLKFKRRSQELDVSIEQKDRGVIEYKADLDRD